MGIQNDQLHRSGTQAPGVTSLSAVVPAPLPAPLPEIGVGQHVLNDLAAGFAHELNQPLAAIAAYAAGAATLLRREPGLPPQVLHIIQAIAGQALRAGAVVEQLRGAARPLPGPGLPLDPNALVRTVLPLLRSLASRQDVGLRLELRTPAPAVLGDASRLQAVLIMLFAGALETVSRLPAERRRVTISTDDGACTVELSAMEPGGTLFQVHLPRVSSQADNQPMDGNS
ncbi:MAG: histidine kinase dimerization/phospho-acceptor domain-containing protein [Gammaproteobacteria bacterium]